MADLGAAGILYVVHVLGIAASVAAAATLAILAAVYCLPALPAVSLGGSFHILARDQGMNGCFGHEEPFSRGEVFIGSVTVKSLVPNATLSPV